MTTTSWAVRAQRLLPRTAWQSAVTAVAGVSLFVAVRAVRLGGFGAFVVAGDTYSDPKLVPGNVPVLAGNGYDGQFFYRLARSPFELGLSAVHGIRFDVEFRGGRILYPFLAWLVSLGGQTSLVPFALVLVNVLAIGVLGYVGARLAELSGRAPAWGLLLAGYFGFSFTIGRDLSEVVAAATVCTALLLIRRSQWGWASLALVGAVLTREQSVLSVAVLAAGALLAVRRSDGLRAGVVAAVRLALPPAVVFLVWQVVAGEAIGSWPALASSDQHTGSPALGVFAKVPKWGREALGPEWHRFALLLLVALVVMVAAACLSGGLRPMWRDHPGEVLLGAASLVVTFRFYGRTTDPSHFRQAYELAAVCWLVLWAGRGAWAVRIATFVVPVTLLVTAYRAVAV